jgi:probable O-glycosylation ligase (exosortase A-associated)
MRDIFLLCLLPFLTYAAIKRPFVGIGLWIWTAMFFPNAWVYGIAGNIRYNVLFAGATILGYLFSKEKKDFEIGSTGVLLLMFLGWTFITTLSAMGNMDMAWVRFDAFWKTVALFIFTTLIVRKKLHIDFMFGCLVLSVGFFAAMEGLKYIASGGNHAIQGIDGHTLGDRNELSIAFSMMLPITFYLLAEYGRKSRIIKIGLFGLICLLVIAIIGTQSRGGFIALSMVGGYLFIKSRRKILIAVLGVAICTLFIGLVPPEWFSRMDTIGNVGGDNSFMGRVVAWKLSFILATHHPFIGGGFRAIEYLPVWRSLSQEFYAFSFFPSGAAMPDTSAHAAHSIYFQVLGEHGFVGLALFLSVLATAYMKAGKVAKAVARIDGPLWLIQIATTIRLTLFAYAVGAAALSFAYFDVTYAVCALAVVLEKKLLPAVLANHKKELIPEGAAGMHQQPAFAKEKSPAKLAFTVR